MNNAYDPDVMSICIGMLLIMFTLTIYEIIIKAHGKSMAGKHNYPFVGTINVNGINQFVIKYITGLFKFSLYVAFCICLAKSTIDAYGHFSKCIFILLYIFSIMVVCTLDIFINENRINNIKIFSSINKQRLYIIKKLLSFIYVLACVIIVFFVIPEIYLQISL